MKLSRPELKEILHSRMDHLAKYTSNHLFIRQDDVEELRLRVSGIEEVLAEIEKGVSE